MNLAAPFLLSYYLTIFPSFPVHSQPYLSANLAVAGLGNHFPGHPPGIISGLWSGHVVLVMTFHRSFWFPACTRVFPLSRFGPFSRDFARKDKQNEVQILDNWTAGVYRRLWRDERKGVCHAP